VFLLLLGLLLLTASCDGSGDSTDGVASLEGADTLTVSPETETTVAVDQEQAMLDFAACMRDNGVDIEDPTVDADGNLQFGGLRGAAGTEDIDRDAMRQAMDTCRNLIEGLAIGPGGGDFDPTELQDTMLEYAACMRDNGFDMPDPDFSSSGPSADGTGEGRGGPFGSIDHSDPDFQVAQQACQDILSGFGRGAIGGGPGGGVAPPSGDRADAPPSSGD
jgi:hypothetical protein